MTQDPQTLISKASQGDVPAVESLLERYLPGLRAFVRLRSGRALRLKESSSDVTQSVCREILQHLSRYRYRGESEFKNWLYATALRKIRNRHHYYAAGKRDVGREIDDPEGLAADAQLLGCYGRFCSPSQGVVTREALERIERAFEKLPSDYRKVILLARIVGLSGGELASEMNRTEVASRQLLARALSALAQCIETRSGERDS
jgi:RNA polymerase sigma-70 factor (subfamily 1)